MLEFFSDKRDGHREKLMETFPSKSPLSLQTDLFAERRSKALDAYLQVLMHCLKADDRILRAFLGIKADPKDKPKSPKIKTPDVFDSEIEKLRMALFSCKDLKSLTDDFDNLQRNLPSELSKGAGKFYELKREWEVMKIKSGQFDERSFDMFIDKEISKESRNRYTDTNKPTNNIAKEDDTLVLDETKNHLREQEAILSDLADTLQQQKQLSKEICEEIKQQNREIGEFGRKQEGTIGDFMQSTEKARKLQ